MTSAFSYHANALCAEDSPLEKIAADIDTPFYVYSTAQLQNNYHAFTAAFAGCDARVYYAVKANPNMAVLRTLADCGAGAEVTSVGELERALTAGILPASILFTGTGKRRDEITAALLARIHQFNVESLAELQLISAVALGLGCRAPVALRLNLAIDAGTHPKIATGHRESKFGIDLGQLEEAIRFITTLPGLAFKGFMMHIGSHLSDYQPFRQACAKLAELAKHWRKQGVAIERLDIGGGVGISYDGEKLPPLSEYANVVRETLGSMGCALLLEPGRKLVGDAGVLVSRVTYVKQNGTRRFLVLDAGMNDLLRPALYGARHSILPLRERTKGTPAARGDVVGPICETSDIFGQDYDLPGVGQGDLVALLEAGAYGAAMSSVYNGRALIPEVLVAGNRYSVVRRRIAVAEQIAWESLPSWITAATP